MDAQNLGADFIKRISTEALDSAAVNHPYLRAVAEGDLPDMNLAFKDFAFQYGLYSARFTDYVAAVIDNLEDAEHRQILQINLEEEQGIVGDIDLPPEVLTSVVGQPHVALFRRFQEALGVDENYRRTAAQCQTGLFWSQQFLQLCEMNQCVGVGAIGLGTELIVSRIYHQILEGLEKHSDLEMEQYVFFNLHSECDEEHAAQIATIAESLAQDAIACEQIEYGVKMAINMRVIFWDKMLERARSFSTAAESGGVSAVGY